MSAGLAVEALTLALGDFRLEKLEFAVSRGEVLVILGPNGAGKSVTLETIAGFHRPDFGRVTIAGRDVTALPPEQRNVGFVVQNFGLFPHLNVAQNVAIARRRGRDFPAGSPWQSDVGEPLAYFGIVPLAKRAPAELSPGEKQRVALARALAGAPELFLFDEPFSALDVLTRGQIRDELKLFLRALALPAVFVTHDHDEAMALADSIVVLRDGAIVQSGRAPDVFHKPATVFVARFLGIENVLEGRVTDVASGTATVEIGERTLRAAAPATPVVPGSSVFIAVRGEDITVFAASDPLSVGGINRLKGAITRVNNGRPLVTISVDCGFPLKAYLLAPQLQRLKLGVGSMVAMEIASAAIHIMAG
jgi:ABC-type Fe3+/spermidine/putrescine transport system ATPase subunit